ncbi:MAG: reverse transcriptase-like protein [Mycoplasma sp.]|nr:reverse transcriptase-like protein [Mycoplasma sp.]
MNKKYYVVLKGKKTGIFNSWNECKKNVLGFSGAIYKSFGNLESANEYFKNGSFVNKEVKFSKITNSLVEKDVELFLQKGYTISFVDGSYNQKIKRFGYGVLIFNSSQKIELLESFNSPEFLESRNVSGEIFGVIAALDWCINHKIKKIKIYYDYEGIERWFDNSWEAKTKIAKYYVSKLENIKSKFDSILFYKVVAHSNIIYNEIADKLAKKSLKYK